jgi:outer membrane receptor protein involved in Fe transport
VTPLPNANLSYALSKTSSLRLAYSRRISRPYIYYLNPYVNRSNPISYSYGNPNLDPELTHSVELSYNNFIKTTSFNVALSVLRTGNSIEQVSFASTQPGADDQRQRGQQYGLPAQRLRLNQAH